MYVLNYKVKLQTFNKNINVKCIYEHVEKSIKQQSGLYSTQPNILWMRFFKISIVVRLRQYSCSKKNMDSVCKLFPDRIFSVNFPEERREKCDLWVLPTFQTKKHHLDTYLLDLTHPLFMQVLYHFSSCLLNTTWK